MNTHFTTTGHRSIRLTISVIAKNEAANIERCLKSASFADQLVVIDGGSSDTTVELAKICGAEVIEYKDWQGFAVQRNRQLEHSRGEYLLLLDADEEITPDLRQEILAAMKKGTQRIHGLRFLEVAFGRELKYASPHKSYQRFFRTASVKNFEGVVHEKAVFKSPQEHGGFFKHHARHYSKTSVRVSLQKLTQYVSLGAYKRRAKGKTGGVLRGLLAGIAAFISTYLFKKAITGGAEGFLYSLFIALEAFFRYAAIKYDDPSAAGRTER